MRYEFDPTAVSATFKTFPKGDYEFSVGEAKAFERVTNEGKESRGVRYPLRCEGIVSGNGDNSLVGERAVYSCYLHGEENPFVKQFLMAALGFPVDETGERGFNERFQGSDWSYDPESGSVGDMWSEPTGGRLIATLDVQMYEGSPRNQWKAFRPVSQA